MNVLRVRLCSDRHATPVACLWHRATRPQQRDPRLCSSRAASRACTLALIYGKERVECNSCAGKGNLLLESDCQTLHSSQGLCHCMTGVLFFCYNTPVDAGGVLGHRCCALPHMTLWTATCKACEFIVDAATCVEYGRPRYCLSAAGCLHSQNDQLHTIGGSGRNFRYSVDPARLCMTLRGLAGLFATLWGLAQLCMTWFHARMQHT